MQDLKDNFYRLSDAAQYTAEILEDLPAIPADVVEKYGLDLEKEAEIFRKIRALVDESDLGKWL